MPSGVAAFDTSGERVAWNPIADGFVYALAVADGTVYLGGSFAQVNGAVRSNLAAIGVDGTLRPWAVGTNAAVHALAISGDVIYAGGAFTQARGQSSQSMELRGYLAGFGKAGNLLPSDPDLGGYAYALAVSGSTLYIGGDFERVGEVVRTSLAALDIDGTVLDWRPRLLAGDDDPIVYALVLTTDGVVHAGGEFGSIGGTDAGNFGSVAGARSQ